MWGKIMNSWNITGRLVAEPDTTVTKTQTLITSVRIAIKKQYKNKETGQYDSDFFNLKSFNKTADYIKSYLNKGDMVEIEAIVNNNNYTKENGEKVYQDAYIINKISKLVSGKKEGF